MQDQRNHTEEYRQLFRFFFAHRLLSLGVALAWIWHESAIGNSITASVIGFAALTAYTAFLYLVRERAYLLALNFPACLGVDVLVSSFYLVAYPSWNSPFFYYTIAPVVVASVLYRFKGGFWAATTLVAAHFVSLIVHDIGPGGMMHSAFFPSFMGEVAAYYVVGFMCVFPADMISKTVQQQLVIKKKTEAEVISTERNRMAAELHDNIAQMLVAIKFKAELLADSPEPRDQSEAKEISKMASVALRELRNSILALRPYVDESFGQMLKDCCRRIGATGHIDLKFEIDCDEGCLSREQRFELLRICQEAIANAACHSGSKTAQVRMTQNGGMVVVEVQDEGSGFNAALATGGFGIRSMQERAGKIDAALDIVSTMGTGTIVRVMVPLGGSPNDS